MVEVEHDKMTKNLYIPELGYFVIATTSPQKRLEDTIEKKKLPLLVLRVQRIDSQLYRQRLPIVSFFSRSWDISKDQGEQANSLRQGEAQNGVVEQHLRQVGLASAGDQQVAEDGTDTQTNASEGDGSEAGADVVQALHGDGDRRGRAGSDEGSGSGSTAGGLSDHTAHHFVVRV